MSVPAGGCGALCLRPVGGRRAAGADHVRSGTPRFAGAGVLALPRSIAYLGWVAGPLMIIVFYLVSLLTSL